MEELRENLSLDIDIQAPKQSRGLSTEEAKRRLDSSGPNQLTPKKQRSKLVIFLLGFVSFFPILLLLAGLASIGAFLFDTSRTDNVNLLAINSHNRSCT